MRLMDAVKYSQINVIPKRSKGVIQISAGGPGSGRKPSNLSEMAESHGFKRLNKSAHLKAVGNRMDSVFINTPKNTWEHRTGSNEKPEARGVGMSSMHQHLTNF